jgi:hypothetical protein
VDLRLLPAHSEGRSGRARRSGPRILSSEVEEALGKLVPAYLRLRGAMELRNALWGYWSACEASTPIDLAIFRAATEALKKGWFASTGAKSNGNYMPKDDFDRVTSDLFSALEGRIAAHPAAKQVMNNLRRQYRMSGNEEVRAFYAEINLPLGTTEQAAMGAANIPAHGGITTGGKLNELVRHGRAYRTLFARTLLRLLGYDGAYGGLHGARISHETAGRTRCWLRVAESFRILTEPTIRHRKVIDFPAGRP